MILNRPLLNSFFNRNARVVAKDLLGTYLVRRVNGKTLSYMIVETEAYLGENDLASHARSGMTARNAPMWGPPGRWYVYFTYGMHYMLNIVTGPEGKPSAVLIRAVETASRLASRKISRRNHSHVLENIRIRKTKNLRIDGPGRLTKALKIDMRLNGKPASYASGLWVEDRPAPVQALAGKRRKKVSPRKIKRTARKGVAYAGAWAEKPFRYVLADEPAVRPFSMDDLRSRP